MLPTKNKVVFISRFNDKTSIDFKLLNDEIKLNYSKVEIVILNHKLRNHFLLLLDILQEMYHLATSKAAIIDSYIIPVCILKHKKNLIVIQIWHALGAIKKFGHSCLDTEEGASQKLAKMMQMHKNYDYIISPGKKTISHYMESFNSRKKQILPYGMPRIDYLINKEFTDKKRNEILNKYPALKKKKNILYFPTFRDNTPIPYEQVIDNVNLDKYNLIIIKHQNDKTKIPNRSNIYVLNQYSVMEVLLISDYFISDYSASFFEAAILDIPFHAYTFDFERYQLTRGLFMDLEKEIPGVVSKNIEDIINGIEKNIIDKKKYANFKKNYLKISDGNSSKKIISLLGL